MVRQFTLDTIWMQQIYQLYMLYVRIYIDRATGAHTLMEIVYLISNSWFPNYDKKNWCWF